MPKPNDDQRKAIAVTAMAEMFGRSMSKAAVKMFVAVLRDIPAADVERAATEAAATCEFMPVPAKLREMAGAGGAKVEDRAILAWMVVERAVSGLGAYKTISFDDPVVNAAIRSLGGWVALCSRPSDDFDKWAKKDFLAAYAALSRSGVSAEMAAPLPGIASSGTVKRFDGALVEYAAPVHEVLTGLPWAGEPVKRLGQQPKRRPAAPRLELKKP